MTCLFQHIPLKWPKRFLLSSCLLLATGFLPQTASAYLEFCNKTGVDVQISVGYHESSSDQWVSEGWWTIENNTCKTPGVLDEELDNRYYYYYAQSLEDDRIWTDDDSYFCLEQGNYIKRSHSVCNGRFEKTGFVILDVGRKGLEEGKFVYEIPSKDAVTEEGGD